MKLIVVLLVAVTVHTASVCGGDNSDVIHVNRDGNDRPRRSAAPAPAATVVPQQLRQPQQPDPTAYSELEHTQAATVATTNREARFYNDPIVYAPRRLSVLFGANVHPEEQIVNARLNRVAAAAAAARPTLHTAEGYPASVYSAKAFAAPSTVAPTPFSYAPPNAQYYSAQLAAPTVIPIGGYAQPGAFYAPVQGYYAQPQPQQQPQQQQQQQPQQQQQHQFVNYNGQYFGPYPGQTVVQPHIKSQRNTYEENTEMLASDDTNGMRDNDNANDNDTDNNNDNDNIDENENDDYPSDAKDDQPDDDYMSRMPVGALARRPQLRRYEVRRPAIQKQFFDIEERIIVRPAGSALVELDHPISQTLRDDLGGGGSGGVGVGVGDQSGGGAPQPPVFGYPFKPQQPPQQIPQYDMSFAPQPQPQPQPQYPTFGYPPQGGLTPVYPTQQVPGGLYPIFPGQGGIPVQGGYPGIQGIPAQGFPSQGFPSQGFPPQGFPPQGFPPQGFPPQGFPPQGFPPQGFPPQGFPPQGFPPQGVPPQDARPPGSQETDDAVIVEAKSLADQDDKNENENEQELTGNRYPATGKPTSTPTPTPMPKNRDRGTGKPKSRQPEAGTPNTYYPSPSPSGAPSGNQPPVATPNSYYPIPSPGGPVPQPGQAHKPPTTTQIPVVLSRRVSAAEAHENQQRLIELLTAKNHVIEIGFGGASGVTGHSKFTDAGNVRARVLSATPAPFNAAPTGDRTNVRRVVISKPVHTIEHIEVLEPTRPYGNDGRGPAISPGYDYGRRSTSTPSTANPSAAGH